MGVVAHSASPARAGSAHMRSAARAASRGRELLLRRFRLAEHLSVARSGRTITQLVEHLEISRATLYRDLDFLRDAGVALTVATVNGEARYSIPGAIAGPLRGLALDLAIASLAPLRGTKLVKELVQLRNDLPMDRRPGFVATAKVPPGGSPDVIATLEAALEERRELVLDYRGARDAESSSRSVRPQELQLVKGQLYLVAWDPARAATRTFKVARIRGARTGAAFDSATLPKLERAPSVVVWRGPTVTVVVRLAPAVARFAGEFPLLPEQQLEPQKDGSVLVRAAVAGDEEALRWVLSCGRNAEVVSPPALRARARDELAAALAGYGPGPLTAGRGEGSKQGVSHMVRQERPILGGAR